MLHLLRKRNKKKVQTKYKNCDTGLHVGKRSQYCNTKSKMWCGINGQWKFLELEYIASGRDVIWKICFAASCSTLMSKATKTKYGSHGQLQPQVMWLCKICKSVKFAIASNYRGRTVFKLMPTYQNFCKNSLFFSFEWNNSFVCLYVTQNITWSDRITFFLQPPYNSSFWHCWRKRWHFQFLTSN